MSTATSIRATTQSSDPVGLIVTLLVRFPEIATILTHPAQGTLELSFVLTGKIETEAKRAVRELIVEHVRSLLDVCGEAPEFLDVMWEPSEQMTFLRILRDARTMTREEMVMLTSLLADHLGPVLLKSPPADDAFEEDPTAQDEWVEYALDMLRDPAQQKSLVGFREEKRVFVYFLSSRKGKKAKARARS